MSDDNNDLFEKINYQNVDSVTKSKENLSTNLKKVFFNNKYSTISIILLMIFFVIAFIITIFFTTNPFLETDNVQQSASSFRNLGTDNFGRDIWSRLWFSIWITFALAICISLTDILIGSFMSLKFIYLNKKSNIVISSFFRKVKVIPSLLILIFLTIIFQETYLIIYISFILTGWAYTSEKIDTEMKKLNEENYIWKSQTLGNSKFKSILIFYILMFPFLLYEFFKKIPFVIFNETIVGIIGIHNSNILTLGGVLGESLKNINTNEAAVFVNLVLLCFFLGLIKMFVINIDKKSFYFIKGEIK